MVRAGDIVILHDPQTTGQARKTIADARGDASDTVRRARIAYQEYRKLLKSFEQAPQLAVSRYWMDAQETIMGNDMVVKTYLPPGVKTILWIKHDPEVWRTIRRKQVEQTREQIDPYRP